MKEVIGNAVDCEQEFVTDLSPVDLTGMNCDMVHAIVCQVLYKSSVTVLGV